ncbi:lipopolysaccharide/colanic/teichoic acid biosynthesis glycosyltransferase [Ureibacillus xyleni]|uniref:Lipopolysaccharide/colanic/teichoic acid biosynthesis glycosyltransferase n=1 Tax=Ureibacillus xyleni TaxID=614648 RepID=A0A285RMM5_9BACL|nr:sugar transferase [Ureibacillus xyleni]SOB93567.1 lipopolysaccharide/colanic/teichoic acid biosynthesis glycosyltransferase [Ureibacillus xyleni]
MNAFSGKLYQKFIKRPLDLLISFVAIVLLSPLLLLVSLLVKIKLGSPIIFKQLRPGRDEKIFTLYKFRTMTNEQDQFGQLLPETIRLTKFGRFLRSTSLDELPQLFNVLKGEMSIIGPRPLLVHYLKLYNEHQKRRHEVRPGLTGLAQVKGRNYLTWEEKFNLDVEYVDNISLLNDIKILVLTLKKVIKREDIYEDPNKIMENFEGDKKQEDLNNNIYKGSA